MGATENSGCTDHGRTFNEDVSVVNLKFSSSPPALHMKAVVEPNRLVAKDFRATINKWESDGWTRSTILLSDLG